jgi:hypothetical protein
MAVTTRRLSPRLFAPGSSRDVTRRDVNMAVKKMALANRWMSVTDVIDRLRARENREQQSRLLEGLEGRAKQRRDEVERSLADLHQSQRSQVVTRAVNGFRSELGTRINPPL